MDSVQLPSRLHSTLLSWNCEISRRSVKGEGERVWLRGSCSHVQAKLSGAFKTGCQRQVRFREESRGLIRATVASEEEVDDTPASAAPPNDGVALSVALLKTAAKTKKVPVSEVCAAIRILEKAKVDPSNFLSTLGGDKSPGRTWLLVFTSDKEEFNTNGGGGKYFPITAVQNFDAELMRIENGVFLGPLGALTFTGKFSWEKRKLSFIFHTINLTIGSLGPYSFGIGSKDREFDKKDPFFIWYYADEEIVVAKGRSGGTAMWVRCINVKKSYK